MNDTELQVAIARLETVVTSLNIQFNNRFDSMEEKMDLKFNNLEEKMDAQKMEHDKDMDRHAQDNERIIGELKGTVVDLDKRIKTLEEAPAKTALDHQNQFKGTLRETVFKALAIGIVALVVLIAGSALVKNIVFTPGAKALVETVTKP